MQTAGVGGGCLSEYETQSRGHEEKEGVYNNSLCTGEPSVVHSLWKLDLARNSQKPLGGDQELGDFLGDMHLHGVGVGE